MSSSAFQFILSLLTQLSTRWLGQLCAQLSNSTAPLVVIFLIFLRSYGTALSQDLPTDTYHFLFCSHTSLSKESFYPLTYHSWKTSFRFESWLIRMSVWGVNLKGQARFFGPVMWNLWLLQVWVVLTCCDLTHTQCCSLSARWECSRFSPRAVHNHSLTHL